MDTLRRQHALLLLICLLLSTIPTASGASQCFTMMGNLIKDQGVVPCNPSATGETGSHSSCCNERTGDICTSTGLCISGRGKTPSGIFWINGCTDSTWRDPSCPQYCNPPFNSTKDSPNPTLRACTPKTFCCAGYYDNDEECCRNSFSLSRGFGAIDWALEPPETQDDSSDSETQPSPSPSKNSESSSPSSTGNSDVPLTSNQATTSPKSSSTKTAAITGGILGTLLAAVSIALGLMVVQNRRLRSQLNEKTAAAAAASQDPPPPPAFSPGPTDYYKYYQQQQQGQGGGAVQEVADPRYGISPPAWIPSELPVAQHSAQLPG